MSWIDLDRLRTEIAASAESKARDAGMANPRAYVSIDASDARGRRIISIEVRELATDDVASVLGRPWQDN